MDETMSGLSSSEVNTDEELQEDLHVRLNSKKFKCSFEACTFSSNRLLKLEYHMNKHTNERPFVCDEPNCEKAYAYPNHLRRHKDVSHSTEKKDRLQCPECDCYMLFTNTFSLKRHLQRKHNPDRKLPFTCNHCGEMFKKKSLLTYHEYEHTGVPRIKCEKCNAYFFNERMLKRHMRTHTTYTCTCGDQFERWTVLLKHKKICDACQPKCNICEKTFKRKRNLKYHLEIHTNTNEKPYVCSYEGCSAKYSYKKNLNAHVYTFHKKIAKPTVKCTEPGCKKSFSRNQTLQNHIKRVHSGEVEKIKKPRKPRKDSGIPKRSAAALLAGVNVSYKTHKDLIAGKSINLETLLKECC